LVVLNSSTTCTFEPLGGSYPEIRCPFLPSSWRHELSLASINRTQQTISKQAGLSCAGVASLDAGKVSVYDWFVYSSLMHSSKSNWRVSSAPHKKSGMHLQKPSALSQLGKSLAMTVNYIKRRTSSLVRFLCMVTQTTWLVKHPPSFWVLIDYKAGRPGI
jgi:hypothetical protein